MTNPRSADPTTLPREVIPRRAARAGLGCTVLSLAAIAAVRWTGGAPVPQDARTVAGRALRFDDRRDGGIDVVDAASGRVLESLHGEQGFLRGTLRGLVRSRKQRGLGAADAPLELAARADGRLTLLDPLTGERIDLESFGPTNAAVFARWVGPPGP